MPRTLEFIGQPGPHRDIEGFVRSLKQARSSISEHDIVKAVRRGNAVNKPRWSGSRWQLFGADILSDDLTSMDIWPLLDSWWRNNLALLPVVGGTVIDDPRQLKTAMDGVDLTRINRRSVMVPPGLSRSYIWTKQNRWQQEVTDADVSIIRQTPILNLCFRDANRADGPVTARTYEYEGADRHGFKNFDDLEAFRKDAQRTPQWRGV